MSDLIEGKVAQILSEDYIVVNRGREAGVKVGMVFVVLAQGEEVRDPDTHDLLGQWEVPKGYVRVTHVQERLCTCQGHVPGEQATEAEDPSTKVLSAAMVSRSMQFDTNRARMNVNRSQVAGLPAVGPISVGDTVREFRHEFGPAAEPPTTQDAGVPKTEEAGTAETPKTEDVKPPETKASAQ